MLSIVVFIYVASGGLRSVAYVDCAQCILLAFGDHCYRLYRTRFSRWMASVQERFGKPRSAETGYGRHSNRPESDSFWERAGTLFDSAGGPWTGLMILTYVRPDGYSAPAFSMGLCQPRSRSLPRQQVFASSHYWRHHVLLHRSGD